LPWSSLSASAGWKPISAQPLWVQDTRGGAGYFPVKAAKLAKQSK
jgi:hypothetical protein